jgi:hypothetical protein
VWWSGWLVQQLVTDADADDGGGGGGGGGGGVDGDGWRQPVAAAAAAGGGAVRHQRCWAAIGARMIGRSLALATAACACACVVHGQLSVAASHWD